MINDNMLENTAQNLDLLVDLLANQDLAHQIPNQAHLFYGSAEDVALTSANLNLASKIALGMALGYVEPAPLVMVYEAEAGQKVVVNLADEFQLGRVEMVINEFQVNSQRQFHGRIQRVYHAPSSMGVPTRI
jgi:hypothetical protein